MSFGPSVVSARRRAAAGALRAQRIRRALTVNPDRTSQLSGARMTWIKGMVSERDHDRLIDQMLDTWEAADD